jgi:hypothetical protein
VTTLNTNGLNFPIKKHRMAEQIEKKRLVYMLPEKEAICL